MFRFLLSFFCWFGVFFRSRHDLGLELCALRQQVGVLKRKNLRPRLGRWDQLFWLALRRLWSKWADALVVVKPETVVRWPRRGFRLYWRFLSRRGPGRPRMTPELRELIQRMAAENPTGGAPKIHGEMLKLGWEVSEPTVSRYLARVGRHREAGKRGLIFLKNHPKAIAAMVCLPRTRLRHKIQSGVAPGSLRLATSLSSFVSSLDRLTSQRRDGWNRRVELVKQ